MKIRRFNQDDWETFGGAERFPNGKEPWILDRLMPDLDFPLSWKEDWSSYTGLTAVADKNGVEIIAIGRGMYWHPDTQNPDEMEISDPVASFILNLLILPERISYQKLIWLGFKEY